MPAPPSQAGSRAIRKTGQQIVGGRLRLVDLQHPVDTYVLPAMRTEIYAVRAKTFVPCPTLVGRERLYLRVGAATALRAVLSLTFVLANHLYADWKSFKAW